jgi:hypothetical protein
MCWLETRRRFLMQSGAARARASTAFATARAQRETLSISLSHLVQHELDVLLGELEQVGRGRAEDPYVCERSGCFFVWVEWVCESDGRALALARTHQLSRVPRTISFPCVSSNPPPAKRKRTSYDAAAAAGARRKGGASVAAALCMRRPPPRDERAGRASGLLRVASTRCDRDRARRAGLPALSQTRRCAAVLLHECARHVVWKLCLWRGRTQKLDGRKRGLRRVCELRLPGARGLLSLSSFPAFAKKIKPPIGGFAPAIAKP